MRIIALSDIHGSYRKVEEILSQETAGDVLVTSGDLTTVGSPRDAEDVIKRLKSFGKPVLAVCGNMDLPALDDVLVRLSVSINGRGVIIDRIGFFGVSGAPLSPLHTPNEICEDEIMRRAVAGWKDIAEAERKVFVPHAPPHNTNVDRSFLARHAGSTAVREFIEKYQPDVTICGHIHEGRGKDVIGKTQVINCGPAGKGYYAVIELGEAVAVENKP
jgi:hypothetical protein